MANEQDNEESQVEASDNSVAAGCHNVVGFTSEQVTTLIM